MQVYKPKYPTYTDEYGVVYSESKVQLIRCPLDFKGEYHVPEGVVSIRQEAFAGCRDLTAVYIPSTIERIENDVFKGCRRLKRIYIPNDEFSIFKYMNALEKYSKYIFVLDKDGQEIKPVVSDKYKVEEVDDSETLSYIKEYLQSLTHIRISDDAKAVIEVILALGVIFFCVLYFAFDLDFWISLLVSPVVSAVGVGVYFLQDWIDRHGGDGGFNGDGDYDFSGGSDEF